MRKKDYIVQLLYFSDSLPLKYQGSKEYLHTGFYANTST